MRTLWNNSVFIDDDGFGKRGFEMFTGAALVAGQSAIQSDMDRRLFGNSHRIWAFGDHRSGSNDCSRGE